MKFRRYFSVACRTVFHVCALTALLLPCAAAARAAVSIVDDAGQRVTLSAPARRVIPLYAALAENMTAMGLAQLIVARTVSDDASPVGVPVVGTHMRPNMEIIAGLRPDLVVQLEGRAEAGLAAEALSRMGIPVARFRVASFEDLFSCLQRLGALCEADDSADALVASMRARLAALNQGRDGARPTVFFEVRYPNLLGAGGGNMLTDIISAAGGRNALASYPERMVRLNEEALAALNPDIYLVQRGAMNKNPTPPDERAHFRTLRAVGTGFVRFVDESRYSRPGPQSVDAAEELAAIIAQWRERQ
jgi:iron complex transport system substrate-binding protein